MLTTIRCPPLAWVPLTATILLSCRVWRVQNVTPVALLEQSKPGRIRVDRGAAGRLVLTNPVVVGDSIRGKQGAVAVADVTAVAVRKLDGLRTLGLVAGMAVGGALACAAAGCLDFEFGNLYGQPNSRASDLNFFGLRMESGSRRR